MRNEKKLRPYVVKPTIDQKRRLKVLLELMGFSGIVGMELEENEE